LLQNDNPAMTLLRCLALPALSFLAACNPTFNWREVRPPQTALSALLPCKPDSASRSITLAGQPVELQMLGCETGGATFAIAWTTLRSAEQAPAALVQWRQATLANMQAATPADSSLTVPGATPAATAQRTEARGRGRNGEAVSGQAAYFAQGAQVFQAVMYAAEPDAQAVQTFFAGLRLN
jgi:hypothetical protein